MQFINNLRENVGDEKGFKTKVFIVIIVLSLITLSGFIIFSTVTKPKTSPSITKEYYDPASKETVSDTPGKTPESYDEDPNKPLYLGFAKLIEIGISEDQLNGIKLAFERYLLQNNIPTKEVSIYVDTIKLAPFDNNSSSNRTMYFDTIINRSQKNKATVEYSGLSDIRLVLKDFSTSKIVYDSGTIDENTQQEPIDDSTVY